MTSFADLLTVFNGGVRLVVKAKPGLSKPRPPRLIDVGEGKRAVEITVSAAPEGGQANKAILAQLAAHLGLKKNQFDVKAGQTGRLKIVEIAGDPQALAARVEAWLSAFS